MHPPHRSYLLTSTSRSTRTSPWQNAVTSASGKPSTPAALPLKSTALSSPASAAAAAAADEEEEGVGLLVLEAVPVLRHVDGAWCVNLSLPDI